MGRPRTLGDKACISCEGLFRPREKNAKFCSAECRHKHLSRPEKECLHCKQLFKGSYAEQKYCSHTCKNEASRVVKTTTCQQCNAIFDRPHGKLRAYCSRSCAMVARGGREGGQLLGNRVSGKSAREMAYDARVYVFESRRQESARTSYSYGAENRP